MHSKTKKKSISTWLHNVWERRQRTKCKFYVICRKADHTSERHREIIMTCPPILPLLEENKSFFKHLVLGVYIPILKIWFNLSLQASFQHTSPSLPQRKKIAFWSAAMMEHLLFFVFITFCTPRVLVALLGKPF